MNIFYRIFQIIFLSGICIFIFGCTKNKSQYQLIVAKSKDANLSLDTQVCEIKITPNRLFSYKIFSASKEGIYCGYNRARSKLDLYDLQKKQCLKDIKIEDFGPNQIRHIDAVYIQNLDSIFVLTNNSVKIIDTSGKVKRNIPINYNIKYGQKIFTDNNFITSTLFYNFFFNPYDHSLYFQNNCITIGSCKSDYYKTAVAGKIDLSKNDLPALLPVSYSKLYLEAYYGFLSDPILSVLNSGKISIGFPIEPVVYIYDSKSKNTTAVGTFPSDKSPVADKLSWDLCYEDDHKMKHFIESPIYSALMADPWNKLNYRFQMQPIKYEKRGNAFTTLNEKLLQLAILDDEMNLQKCIPIPDRKMWLFGAFVQKGGIYVPAPRGENTLRFKILKIKKT